MKTKPILFSTPMVQAILENKKKHTRRIINIDDLKKEPDSFIYLGNSKQMDIPRIAKAYDDRLYHAWELKNSNMSQWVTDSCKPNDTLWVRETWRKNNTQIGWPYDYRATAEKDGAPTDEPWKPSIFMPREACRLFLKVESIRVERLQNISESDAISEGIEGKIKFPDECPDVIYWRDYQFKDRFASGEAWGPRQSYKSLWQKINGPQSWELNPWVWVIKFSRIDKPKNF